MSAQTLKALPEWMKEYYAYSDEEWDGIQECRADKLGLQKFYADYYRDFPELMPVKYRATQ